MTREEAIEQLKLWLNYLYPDTDIYHAVAMAIEALKALKTGKWEYTTHYGDRYRTCSVCHAERRDDLSSGWNYCPNCGAKMMEE